MPDTVKNEVLNALLDQSQESSRTIRAKRLVDEETNVRSLFRTKKDIWLRTVL